MTKRIYVDRSRYEDFLRCNRLRYLGYHFGGVGITSAKKPLPLCVGGSVHVGLAELLRRSMDLWDQSGALNVEDDAVAAALADFSQHKSAISAEGEQVVSTEAEEYLYAEQSALIEGTLRAYARRRLRPLLEQYEVLEVEREGEWQLASYNGDGRNPWSMEEPHEIVFMSRPDALLRDRQSNQLVLLSYKTAASWDIRKAKDAEHDMQGMSEGIEIERRLGEWHRIIHTGEWEPFNKSIGRDHPPDYAYLNQMYGYLKGLDTPPRILAVRYEYLLKGERWKDKELTERFGVETRSQKSHLVRQYAAVSVPQRGAAGYAIGDVCWSWDFIRDDGRDGNLAWQNWKSRPVWDQPGGVRAWIDKLDDAAETMSGEDSTMGLEPRLLGYKCDAQAVGVTRQHPLDAIFIPPMLIYRSDDSLRDMVEQMEANERRTAEGVAAVDAASDEAEQRHLLNTFFSQTLRACHYPSDCAFVPICHGGDEIKRDPLGSGRYRVRVPNHPVESEVQGE